MNALTKEVPVFFGETKVASWKPGDMKIGYSPVEYKVNYINNLPVPITVQWRNGFKFTLRPEPNLESSHFIVRVEIKLAPTVKNDVHRLLSAVGESSSAELQALKKAFSLSFQENSNWGATLVLDYPLSLQKLEEYGGTLYYSEIDTVFSLLPFETVPAHPYSEEGRNLHLIDVSSVSHKKVGFGYSIDMVDNTGKHGDRYLNIGNKVYRVIPKKDSTRREGIYIISNAPVQGKLDFTAPMVKHYPFSSAEEIGLYRTPDEAAHLGDISLARKQELADLEHNLQIEKKNLQLVEQRHSLEMADKNKELKKLEIERDARARELEDEREKAELERQRIKDYYESRSHVRKDNSEALKFLPALVVGIGAVFMGLRTIMGTK